MFDFIRGKTMGQCVECKISMGFTGNKCSKRAQRTMRCMSCKVIGQTKGVAVNKPHSPTNVKSIDNLFTKFEDMLITSETSSNLRIRKRFGVVHGEGIFAGENSFVKKILSVFIKRFRTIDRKTFKNAIEDAIVELKAASLLSRW